MARKRSQRKALARRRRTVAKRAGRKPRKKARKGGNQTTRRKTAGSLWKEAEHPRHRRGTSKGGKFRKKFGSTGSKEVDEVFGSWIESDPKKRKAKR
jgi:hypothetical protein